MKECVDLNQVRYYGVKKVDPKLLETLDKTIKLSRGLLFSKITKIMGQIKNLKNKIEATKDESEKAVLKAKLKKLADETNQMIKDFNSGEKKTTKKVVKKTKEEDDEAMSKETMYQLMSETSQRANLQKKRN